MSKKKVPCHCDKCRGRHVPKRIEQEHCNRQGLQEKSGQKRQRTDSGVNDENLDSKKKPKADHPTTSFFEQAKSLFPLDKRAKAATERGWEIYIANRVAAEKEFPGPKETVPGEDDDEDEDEYDPRGGEPDFLYALNLMRCRLASLENEMELDKGVLLKSFRVLDCEPDFEDEDEPRTVTTSTRIYSPTQPVYIDIHFSYECRPRRAWGYSLKFKIYSRPGTNDFKPYSRNGWSSIAHGSYSHYDRSGKKWVKVENTALDLGEDDVKQVYEALWGPLDDIRGDDEDKQEMDRRRKIVDAVRVLLAAVGIGYDIAINDDEEDDPCDVYMLEGLSDRWFARGVRKACGFQLKNDLENEKKRLAEREKAMNRIGHTEEASAEGNSDGNSDEDGMSDEDD